MLEFRASRAPNEPQPIILGVCMDACLLVVVRRGDARVAVVAQKRLWREEFGWVSNRDPFLGSCATGAFGFRRSRFSPLCIGAKARLHGQNE
jgi:hypothetical protein